MNTTNLDAVCRRAAELAALEPAWVLTLVEDAAVPDLYHLEVVQGYPEAISMLPFTGHMAVDADFAMAEWLRRRFREHDEMLRSGQLD